MDDQGESKRSYTNEDESPARRYSGTFVKHSVTNAAGTKLKTIEIPVTGAANKHDLHVYHELHANNRNLLLPVEIYVKVAHIGGDYALTPIHQNILLSIVGGMFVALGAATAFMVAGTMSEAPSNPDTAERNYGVFKLIYAAFGYPFAFTGKSTKLMIVCKYICLIVFVL